jgi:hypothetical protein
VARVFVFDTWQRYFDPADMIQFAWCVEARNPNALFKQKLPRFAKPCPGQPYTAEGNDWIYLAHRRRQLEHLSPDEIYQSYVAAQTEVPACLPLPACLPAGLPACRPAGLPAGLPASLSAKIVQPWFFAKICSGQ